MGIRVSQRIIRVDTRLGQLLQQVGLVPRAIHEHIVSVPAQLGHERDTREDDTESVLLWGADMSLRDRVLEVLDPDCLRVLIKLAERKDEGIPLEELGLSVRSWPEVQRDGDCACVSLVKWGLAEMDAGLKALVPTDLFKERSVQYLLGVSTKL